MENVFNKEKVKQDFDNAINKIISLVRVQQTLEQMEFIEINLNRVRIVNYEVKHDKNNKSIYYLVLQMGSDGKILYKLINETDEQKVIISTSEISDDYIYSINAIYAIISYFENNDNFNNIMCLIQSSMQIENDKNRK